MPSKFTTQFYYTNSLYRKVTFQNSRKKVLHRKLSFTSPPPPEPALQPFRQRRNYYLHRKLLFTHEITTTSGTGTGATGRPLALVPGSQPPPPPPPPPLPPSSIPELYEPSSLGTWNVLLPYNSIISSMDLPRGAMNAYGEKNKKCIKSLLSRL